ncbi:MAG: hypothetical protein COB24_11250 [Hyphomicrobiales bacterium]|nr:MAG: hypothetical protein COB24_11250 [Hyphomicrobiales bacterium]
MKLTIRPADSANAKDMVTLTTRSITELCAADHDNEPQLLAEWLDNKTVEQMTNWIEQPDNYVIVAYSDEVMVAAGGTNIHGRILRNYVHPEYRFKGISRAIMAAMEKYLRGLGLKQATLESSKTAFEFYLSCGWKMVETDDKKIEMIKIL